MPYFIYSFFIFFLVAALLGLTGMFVVSAAVAHAFYYLLAALFILSIITQRTEARKRQGR